MPTRVNPGDWRATAVVLTHQRREEVLATVARLRAGHPGLPVVVVDNASTDGTAGAVAARWRDVDVVALERNRGAAGRNAGVARATTPYVALCDDDTWWAPGDLARAAAVLDRHPTLAVVTARVLVGAGAAEDPTNALMAASPLPRDWGLPGREILGFLAGASVVRRDAFLVAGGFEPRLFIGGEEELLALDLAVTGWRMTYLSDLTVHHHPSSARDACARRRLLLRNALWCAWLRRRTPAAIRRSVTLLQHAAWRDGTALRGLAGALCGLPWVLRHRRPVPADVAWVQWLVEREVARQRHAPAAGRAARPRVARSTARRLGVAR